MIERSEAEQESLRLQALEVLQVLDTPREAEFDELAALAAEICGTPIGVVNLIGNKRQFFKAEVGLGVRETPLESSFCAHAILEQEFMLVPDAQADDRFSCNPLVTSDPHIRFYAGALLRTAEGFPIGTLCVLGYEPKALTETQQRTLRVLARQAMTQLELRQALRERDDGEHRNKALIDSVTDFAIIGTDATGSITRWNTGATNVIGWTENDMVGQNIDRIFTTEDRQARTAETERRIASVVGRSSNDGWRLRADGTEFWAQGKMTPLRSAGGDVTGYVKILRDRTHERERELRVELLARASAALLSADDPDAVIDAIVTAGAEVLGIDRSYSHVLTPDGKHLRLTHGIGLTEEMRTSLQEVSFEDPICGLVAGSRKPLILSNLQSNTDPNFAQMRDIGTRAYAGFPIGYGDTLYGVISFCSLTEDAFDAETLAFFETLARFLSIGRERLDREAMLSDLNMGLELRVEERTRELMRSEEALRQSQKMDAVGQLTGGVAHDFNNLLTVIRGSADLLKRDNLTPERRTRYIDAISDTADRATKLTGQLLAFARRQTLKPELFDVAERLMQIVDMVGSVIGARVKVEKRFPGVPCLVLADASQFETALVNMAVNARDAMNGEGKLTIVLDHGRSMPAIRGHAGSPGPFVTIRLEDTGTGINPDALARIFEPFYTTKEVGRGTGLGLSQVFGFAKQSGGDVDVSNGPSGGAAFTLFLPEAAGQLASKDQGPTDELLSGNGVRVLIVEDNVEVRQFSEQILQDFGYVTDRVGNAEDALDRITSPDADYGVVFSDVVMPGMGGLELAKRLAHLRPELPIVLASGYSHVLAQEGTHGFELISKPYSADDLSRALRHAVNGGANRSL